MNLEITCPSSPDYKYYALRFGFWGTLAISSGRRATVGLLSDIERHRTNARLIAWQKKQYSFLWVVTNLCSGGFSSGFSCCFHGKYRYDSTLIYCWKLSELPNCVFLWFEKHFASHSSHCRSSLERRQSHVMSKLPSPSTTTRRLVLQNLPSLGMPALTRPPPIWRVLNKLRCERLPNNEALQWAILSTQSFLRVVFCHNAVSVNFKHDIRGSKFTLIIKTLKPIQSWLC